MSKCVRMVKVVFISLIFKPINTDKWMIQRSYSDPTYCAHERTSSFAFGNRSFVRINYKKTREQTSDKKKSFKHGFENRSKAFVLFETIVVIEYTWISEAGAGQWVWIISFDTNPTPPSHSSGGWVCNWYMNGWLKDMTLQTIKQST